MTYKPSSEILEKYADVIINYGLNNGKGAKKGETIYVVAPLHARPLLFAVQRKALETGCKVITGYVDDELDRAYLKNGSVDQLDVYGDLYEGLYKQADHTVKIVGHEDPSYLKGISTELTQTFRKTQFGRLRIREKYELKGEHSWTLVLYPTQVNADEANMTLEEYWNEVIIACYLDKEDVVGEWKKTSAFLKKTIAKLNALQIDTVHVEAPGTDLTVKIGARRVWVDADGANIPSYEIFTSPDWRGTNGHTTFTEPLYYNGAVIKDIYLEFTDGIVTKATASQGEDVLKSMIAIENANKVGEFSLTDRRVSNITKFMAETLFDENVGGPQGNTHIALGNAYRDIIDTDPKDVTDEEYERLGYNASNEHTDIMSTSPRKVTATLADGSKKVIYENGEFTL
jgi:aminopeptidase